MSINTKKNLLVRRTRSNKDNNSTDSVNNLDNTSNLLDIMDLKHQLSTKKSILENNKLPLDILFKQELKYQNTFVIDKDVDKHVDLEYDILIKLLEDLGLTRSSDTKANHLFGIINKKYYNTNFLLLNDFQFIADFENKFSLYNNLKICFPHHYNTYYPQSFILNTNTYWNENFHNKIYIARPINSCAGVDVVIVYNEETFNKAKTLIYKPLYKTGVSLTEYITNPLLIRGRKFHCRAYLMFTLFNNKFKTYLLKESQILTAKYNYKNADWANKDIHDTHFKSSYRNDLIFPNDLYGETTPMISEKDIDIIYNNSRMLCKEVSKIAVANVYHYSNTKNTWQIFGIDLLIKDDLNVFIIEINGTMTGYGMFNSNKKIEKPYFDWISDVVVKPCLFPHLEIPQKPSNIPLYEAVMF